MGERLRTYSDRMLLELMKKREEIKKERIVSIQEVVDCALNEKKPLDDSVKLTFHSGLIDPR